MAASASDEQTTRSRRARAGEVSGTLSYMAPEVLRGEPGDARSDIWALGVVLYEAASGQMPFRGKTAFEMSSAILREMPTQLPSRVPPGLWSIVQRALAKEPAQRYQQASEVQAALEAVQSASSAGTQTTSQPSGYTTLVSRGTRHLKVGRQDVLLLVGTTKGAFLLKSTPTRSKWDIAGPYFHGHAVYAMGYDGRDGRHRLWASTQNFWGTFLRSSDDYGRSWMNPLEANVKFPSECGVSLKNIWQILLSGHDRARMYCGVEPASLFESQDSGDTWSLVRGLFDHPHRPRWQPGNGGLALHTILEDPVNPDRMDIAISAGGVYRTDDGGRTWEARNSGIRVAFQPEKYPEFGQCVHKIVLHPARPERRTQNHWGLYRSDDSGDSWQDIARGVPSDFGFAMAMHPPTPTVHLSGRVWTSSAACPRVACESTDAQRRRVEPLSRGLPCRKRCRQRDAWQPTR
jgi:photosystem II stability/assembly factor-like uncharacterized protein